MSTATPAAAGTPVSVARSQPADHAAVRRHNLGLVLRLLRSGGPRSRAGIAVATGLNKATVSSLVAELESRGLVRDVGTDRERRLGRPATLVELDGRGVLAIGLEVNVDFLSVLVTDVAGREVHSRTRPIDARHHSLDAIVALLVELSEEGVSIAGPTRRAVTGCTVAVPGVVDVDAGVVRIAPNLGWHDVPFAAVLGAALGAELAVTVDNEANLAALAEHRVGQHAGVANLLYVIGEVGLGGGIVVDGHLVRGASGFGGEIGHMTMERDGLRCNCGSRGCWETLVALPAVLRAAVPDRADELAADENLSPEDKIRIVAERASSGDAVALAALRDVGEWLGVGLANLFHVLNPDIVVLAGIYPVVAEWVVPVATEVLAEQTLGHAGRSCPVVVSSLGFSAAARGGAIHAAERVFDDPLCVPVLSDQKEPS
jgi:predicted NBD/HSP70 family sugar kinase